MVRKCVAFLTGRWGLAQRKSNCKEHAGSDKMFENITLFLYLLPLKIQFKKEKRTLKTLGLSRETNKLQVTSLYGRFFRPGKKGHTFPYKKNR